MFGQVALPTVYRSVVFLDVFGWLAEHEQEQEHEHELVGTAGVVDSTDGIVQRLASDEAGQLSPVQEETSPHRAFFPPNASGDYVPPHLCNLLLTDCQKLRAALRQDL